MDIRISGMFSNLIQPNKHVHLDEIQHNEPLAHLLMWLQLQNADDLDHFDDESIHMGKKTKKPLKN